MSPAVVEALAVVAGVIGFGVVIWYGIRGLARLMSPHDWD